MGELMDIHRREVPKDTFIKRYFNTGVQLSKSMVENALFHAVRGNSAEDINDVVRLLVLHLCVSFLFANTGNTLGWVFAKYIHDVEKIGKYNWAEAIHKWLLDSIQKKMNDGSPATVTGCVPIILFWFCEVVNVISPIKERQNLEPRFLRWDLHRLNRSFIGLNMNKLQVKKGKGQSKTDEAGQSENVIVMCDDNSSDDDFVADVERKPKRKCPATCAERLGVVHRDVVISLLDTPTPPNTRITSLVPPNIAFNHHTIEVSSNDYNEDEVEKTSVDLSDSDFFNSTSLQEMMEIEKKDYERYGTQLKYAEYVDCLEEENDKLKEEVKILEAKVKEKEAGHERHNIGKSALENQISESEKFELTKRLAYEFNRSNVLVAQITDIGNRHDNLKANFDRHLILESTLKSYVLHLEEKVHRLNKQVFDLQEEADGDKTYLDVIIGEKEETVDHLKSKLNTFDNEAKQLRKQLEDTQTRADGIRLALEGKLKDAEDIVRKMNLQITEMCLDAQRVRETQEEKVKLIALYEKDLNRNRMKMYCSNRDNQELRLKINTLRDMVVQLGGDPDCPNTRILRVKTTTARTSTKKPEYSYEPQQKKDKTVGDVRKTINVLYGYQENNLQCSSVASKKICEGLEDSHCAGGNSNMDGASDSNGNLRIFQNLLNANLVYLLDNTTKEKLRFYSSIRTDEMIPVWKFDVYSTSVHDISALLWQDAISNSVIDSYCEILSQKFNQSRKNKYLSTLAWEMVRMKNNEGIQEFLVDMIFENIKDVDHIFIPMRHTNSTVFSLLYLEKCKRMWLHYNPNSILTEATHDRFYDEAKKMHGVIRKCLNTKKREGSELINAKPDGLNACVHSTHTSSNQTLSCSEDDNVLCMLHKIVEFPLVPYKHSRRQTYSPSDYGIVVMYYMRELSLGTELTEESNPTTMLDMRAHLTDVFLNHKYSCKNAESHNDGKHVE